MGMGYTQPIIRGIEAVGAVKIQYHYNGGKMVLPTNLMRLNGKANADNNTLDFTKKGKEFVNVAGFRLDSSFLQANPQIASSFQIPILGGGAIALTNNNRSGILNINCTRVSTPLPGNGVPAHTDANGVAVPETANSEENTGSMYKPGGAAIGPLLPSGEAVYDLVFLAQVQQAQVGGDSQGSTIRISFDFCGLTTTLEFQGCTIASVAPVALSGNDAVDYGVAINYLNWTCNYSSSNGDNPVTD